MMQERFKSRCRQVIFQVPLKCEWVVEGAYERLQENHLKFNFILDEIVFEKKNHDISTVKVDSIAN